MAVAPVQEAAVQIPRPIDVSSLPTFGQDVDDDIIDFFERYEMTLEFYELSNELKAKLVPQVLKKRALTFYRTLTSAVKENYDDLKQTFTQEFDVPQIRYRKRQMLYQITQDNESISEYLGRLEKLSQNLNIPDQSKLDIMIAGLNDGYRKYIQMRQPETYREATHSLLLKEAVNPLNEDY